MSSTTDLDLSQPHEQAAVRPPRPRRWRRRLRRIALIVFGVYLALLAALFFLQEALIFPGRSSQGSPESAIRPAAGGQVVELSTPDGHKVAALFGSALSPVGAPLRNAASRPTILYFYGNGEYLGGSHAKFAALRRRGLNVMMVDYLGYGQSGGEAGESGCRAAAEAAYRHLAARSDIDPENILFGGFSLGGAVAIDMASRHPCSALIVSCTFTSLSDMAWRQYPFVPVPLLLRHKFPSREAIAGVKVPTLIASGTIDPIIPGSMADALAKAAGGPVTRVVMKGADHADLVRIALEDEEISAALDRFLAGVK